LADIRYNKQNLLMNNRPIYMFVW